MGLTSIALKFAAPIPKVESFDRFLFVGPHPDDIEIGAGATVAKLAAQGKEISFLICLDGRFGDGLSGGVTGDDLALLRREEAVRGAKALGVEQVYFLGRRSDSEKVQAFTVENMMTVKPVCDGGFYPFEDLVCGIAQAVSLLKPQIVFGPDPFSRSECHADHLNVGNAVRQVSCFAPYAGIMKNYVDMDLFDNVPGADVKAVGFYMTARPNRYVKTSAVLLKRQLNAIQEHRSQFPEGSTEYESVQTYLRLRSLDFGLRRVSAHAEGFRVYGQTQMHCLPEAGEY